MLFANIGLPMIFVSVPIMAMALVPIAFVEALVFRRFFSLPFAKAWKRALLANLWSTFLGVPVAWFIMLLVQFIGGFVQGAFGLDTPLERLAAVYPSCSLADAIWKGPCLDSSGRLLVLVDPFLRGICSCGISMVKQELRRSSKQASTIWAISFHIFSWAHTMGFGLSSQSPE